jgi:hypothetical protein
MPLAGCRAAVSDHPPTQDTGRVLAGCTAVAMTSFACSPVQVTPDVLVAYLHRLLAWVASGPS